MKKGIHPEYNEITVELSDGSTITTRSTLNPPDGVYKSEVDSRNHPFYTNKQRMKQKAGRIDKFNEKYGKN